MCLEHGCDSHTGGYGRSGRELQQNVFGSVNYIFEVLEVLWVYAP